MFRALYIELEFTFGNGSIIWETYTQKKFETKTNLVKSASFLTSISILVPSR